MPNRQKHRGKHPQDEQNFGAEAVLVLRRAVRDLSQLLTWGYTENSALKLVGDRYQLNARQRKAVGRGACSDEQLDLRRDKRVRDRGEQVLWIDAFNQIISIEAALAGGYLFRGRDGLIRDLASVHGSYRKVAETERAIALIAEICADAGFKEVHWLIDQPVSNSGQMLSRLYAYAEAEGLPWQARVVYNPDRDLVDSGAVVASTDSWVLDHARNFFDLSDRVIQSLVRGALVVELAPSVET